MSQPLRVFLAGLAAVLLSGCLAGTALDVVTLPVRAAGTGIDAVTTSQAEADRKRGRALRQREERLGELDRRYREATTGCAAGQERACREARALGERRAALSR